MGLSFLALAQEDSVPIPDPTNKALVVLVVFPNRGTVVNEHNIRPISISGNKSDVWNHTD